MSLIQEIRSLPTDRKTLRSFGRVVGAVFLLGGALLLWRVGGWGWWIPIGAGSALVLLGLAAPLLLRPVYRAWMTLALVLGFVMTRVLLTLVFFGIVTPTGLIMRLFGKDPMNRRPDPSVDTYWIARDADANNPERMKRYF